uniref:Ubiquinol-cytochrome c reductase complex assembly factor 1 n=1 Tax=Rousettus aegyptiacus TaxID=9407 RepID=A0A7J8DLU9_ROUAE|nr:ubiquinol-cytochrome c reductase complex assembly factor 1 [Rousettus aegyptiacus]
MALLVRVLRKRISISQWVPVCSRLVPVSATQGQWGRALSGTSQWLQMSQSLACGGSEQIPGMDMQLSRKYHTTNKLSTTKDSPQPVEEKVGAFTKIIEAMGFTGPLKYSKWVNPYILKKNMMVMTNNFYAAILGYDEGILSDDHGLAAALWRSFFNQKCEDPRQLELLVEYVRKQIQYLDSMNGEDLLLTGEVSWRPLVEKNPQSILKPHSPVYNDEGL